MRFAHPALALLGALASTAGAAAIDDGNANSTAIPGSYIVEFEGDDDMKAFYDSLRADGIEVDRRMNLNYRLFKGASFSLRNLTDADATADRIGALPRVKSLWPVRKVQFPRPEVVSVGASNATAHAAHLQTRQGTVQDLFTPHLMTQVSKLHEKGISGKGMRIGIIDTGVDYLHPALGGCFGEGCLVSYGYDLNGDDSTSPVPIPDADPLNNCDPHGTHVAGIIAAQPNELGFTGAAPGATIGMYKVSGCGGTTTNEMIAAAINMAYEAGSDIISMSAGDDSGWSSDPWAVSASRVAAAGTPLIIANGNSGNLGLWYPATPASGREVTAVGSVENTVMPMMLERGLYTVNNGSTSAFGIMNRGNPSFSRNVTLPLWAVSNSTETIDDACQALPAGTPDLSDKVVLVREAVTSKCLPTTQATNIAAMGGRYILWYSNEENSITNVYVYLDEIRGVAQTTAAQGAQWIEAINQGEVVTVTISATGSAGVFVQEWKAPASGGYTSSMSTWGPTWEVDVKPQFTAPGGNILSTYPVSQGSYAVISGTSMATPMVAGIFALLGEARGTLDIKLLRSVLSATAKPKAWFDGTAAHDDMLASVAQQGAGLVQAYDAAFATTILSVSSLSFNDSDNFVANRTISIQNTAPVEVTYILGHAKAVTVYSLADGPNGILSTPSAPQPISNDGARVSFSSDTVTVPAGGSVGVTVSVEPPTSLNATLLPVYSGYITLNNTGGDEAALSLPYLGVWGSLHDTPTLQPGWEGGVYLTDTQGHFNIPSSPNTTFTIPRPGQPWKGNEVAPKIRVTLTVGSPMVRVDLVAVGDSTNVTTSDFFGHKTVGMLPDFPRQYPYRNGGAGATFRGRMGDGSVAPEGTLAFLVSALRINGDAAKQEDWDFVETVPFNLKYTS